MVGSIFFWNFFYSIRFILFIMIITVDVLSEILDKVPGDYEVEFVKDGISYPVLDKVEVDVSGKKFVLKS